jgi:ubiquinol-cytochrome c reductase iron-sulfur subunit
MAESEKGVALKGSSAVERADRVDNPGFEPAHKRIHDVNPDKAASAERGISLLFLLSGLLSVAAFVFYFLFPIVPGDLWTVRLSTLLIGVAIAASLLTLGVGVVHWAKTLMHGHDLVEERHGTRGDEPTRARAVEIFQEANAESGWTRRRLLRNSLITALVAFPVPAIALFRDLAPAADPVEALKHTIWRAGTRLARDPSGTPIKASEITIGSAVHVIPENLGTYEETFLNEKAKAAVLLMRLDPADLNISEERKDWSYDGIVAYSKICTHVGCPVALYEQQTHHLLCPCHQSQFDVSNECAVIVGPAARPLPQLPISVDAEGYLVAQSDFLEPVGPSFWERNQ